jgi:hypothetical protein
MKSALLAASGVWPAGLGTALLGLVSLDQAPVLKGEIIFERTSYCDYFVVQTESGFAFLEVSAGLVAVAGGRWVTGRLTASGHQTVDIDGRATLAARVVAWDTVLSQAKARFDRYCDPGWLDLGPEGGRT